MLLARSEFKETVMMCDEPVLKKNDQPNDGQSLASALQGSKISIVANFSMKFREMLRMANLNRLSQHLVRWCKSGMGLSESINEDQFQQPIIMWKVLLKSLTYLSDMLRLLGFLCRMTNTSGDETDCLLSSLVSTQKAPSCAEILSKEPNV
jgi:hypothetical protein